MTLHTCRFCSTPLSESFVDLGVSPLANSFVAAERAHAMEPFFPLDVRVCPNCLLVQLAEYESAENIFSDYLYFSSFSDSWLDHCRRYAGAMIDRFRLDGGSKVVEIASNDGYLLQYFVAAGIPVLGVEPAANVAEVARAKGVTTEVAFFGAATAQRLADAGHSADLMAANNVLAHVPDLNDFVAGFRVLLKPQGVATFEFPHLLQLIGQSQFDTIYHEHFSYLSLLVVAKVAAAQGLKVIDVETLPTHGGSLRVYVARAESDHAPGPAVAATLAAERAAGLDTLAGHQGFAAKVSTIKEDLLSFLIEARRAGKRVVGYGAPAKGNTLLNYCGVKPDHLAFTVDRSPHKQGRLLPGTRIPIRAPADLLAARPDYVLILPWNLRDEIAEQMAQIRDWGGRFVVPIPRLEIF